MGASLAHSRSRKKELSQRTWSEMGLERLIVTDGVNPRDQVGSLAFILRARSKPFILSEENTIS